MAKRNINSAQLDIFETEPTQSSIPPCRHCGGENQFIEAEPSITYDCMIMACTRCTFKTKRTFVGSIANPDYKQLLELWTHGTPTLVAKPGENRLLTMDEFFDFFPERKPVLLIGAA
jgi:hypothetical protein